MAVNHTRRGDFAYRQAKQLIDDGAIGEVHTMIVHFSGELMFIGSHGFDLLNYFNGDCPVAWMNGHLDDDEGFDAGGNAYMVYENGVRAFVNGTTGHAVGFRAQVIGTAGEIIIGNYDLQLWRVDSSANRRELVMHPFPQVYRAVSPMVALIEEAHRDFARRSGPDFERPDGARRVAGGDWAAPVVQQRLEPRHLGGPGRKLRHPLKIAPQNTHPLRF